jgi:multidrug efflux pump subunit AcrA (membrane-fusion protein)
MNKSSDALAQPTSATATPPPSGRNGTLSDRVRSLQLGERTTPGGQRSSVVPWTLAGICLLLTVGFAYYAYRTPNAGTTSQANDELKDVLGQAAPEDVPELKAFFANRRGKVSKDVAESGEVVLESKGYLFAVHQVQISPQVGGEIIWLDPSFKEGAIYKKGDRLAEVDPIIYQAQVKSAEAALQVAKTNLKQVETGSTLKEIDAAKATLKNLAAKLELSRIDERFNRSAAAAVSRHDLERSIAQVTADEAALAAQKETVAKLEVSLEEQRLVAKSQVQSAEAAKEQAQKQLKNCTITAPTTGVVLTKKAELGGYVNPLAYGNVAGYLCEMADLSKIEVELSIQERDFPKVMPPTGGEYQICTVMPEAFARDNRFLKLHPHGYDGYVSRIMPVADQSKGAITVRVRVRVPEDEAGVYLKPAMGLLVSFKSKTTKDVEKD